MSERLHGMFASAAFKVAHDKLVAALQDPAVTDTKRGIPVSELQETKDEMESILPVLMDADRLSVCSIWVVLWLQQLEEPACDIWDMVDEIRTNKDATARMARNRMLPRSVPVTRPDKLSSIRQALREIREEQSHLDFRQRSDNVQDQSYDYFLLKEIVVGRDEQVDKILDFLLPAAGMSGQREWPVFLPIFGLAGVGKTTLAQLVYDHPRSIDYYHASRAWVHVSPSFDLRRIGRSIIESLTYESGEEGSTNVLQDDLDSIERRIHELLGDGRKVLVILDDIWEQDQQELDRLKSLLGVGNQAGSCNNVVVDVIVTTRDEGIARRICTNKVQPYKLHPLSDDQCWEIIKQERLEGRNDKQDLDKIGREIIATKCGGLPLVAKSLGYMLRRDKRDEQWLEIARTGDLSIVEPMMKCLSLSYQSMPPNLRLCFAYLGTLPNRHNMAEDDIIHRWIALGLIEPTTNGISTAQQIISRLLDISFLEHSNLASTSKKRDDNKGIISFTMPNMICFFARSLLGSTLVVADGEHTRDPGTRCCRYAVLTNFDLASSKLSRILPAEIRALNLLGCRKMDPSNDLFSFAKYLRVLELREPSMHKLPDSVCELGLLGYLNLSGCSGLVKLPESFGTLTNVMHVNLSGCSGLVKLPESFGTLTNVMHVNLSGCSALVKLPESFGNLTNVMHVNLSGCTGLVKLPESFGTLTNVMHVNLSGCSGLVKLPESFGTLTNVMHVNLSGCSGLVKLPESFVKLTSVLHINLSGCSGLKSLPKSFGNLTSVVHIDLSGCHGLDHLPKSFCKLSTLESLDLSFCSCPRELQTALGGLTNLRHLNLSHPTCYAVEVKHKDHLEQLKGIWAKLTKLQYLNLSTFMNPIFCNMPEEKSRLDCFEPILKGLSGLEDLDLSHNIFLVDLPETLCDLSNLHTLNLSGCIRLKRITKKIAEMKCTIILRKCPNLESYPFVVYANDEAYRSNLVQLEDTVRCKELEISCLEKLKSVEDAKRIRLYEKSKLRELALSWTRGCSHVSFADDEALLTELVPPENLQRLALKGYGGNDLPAWLTSSLCLHLPNLEEITMENIPKCHALPPFLLLPKLKQVVIRKMDGITRIDAGELCGGGDNRAELHRLLKFTLDDMENLQEFDIIYRSGCEEFMFPTIDELVIQNCPNLKFGPLLPTVQRLQISACDQVMFTVPKREAGEQRKGVEASSSSTSAAAAPRVTQLVVENCKVPLGDWSLLSHLHGLCRLEIRGSNDLTGSPETTHTLSSLQSLRFYQCNGMTSLPEFLRDLTSLQELTIDACQDIESMPDSIAKLRNLKDLCIPGCPNLQEWCKSADNKQKLAHIQIRESATVEPGTTANQTTNRQLTRGQSSLLIASE